MSDPCTPSPRPATDNVLLPALGPWDRDMRPGTNLQLQLLIGMHG